MEAAHSPADPAPSPTRPLPVLSVGREGWPEGTQPGMRSGKWGLGLPAGPRPRETTPTGATPNRTTPMGCHAHEITHPTGPRPREAMPMWDHAHGVMPKEVQCSRVRDSALRAPAVPPQGGCLPLRASLPLSGHGVCKALRSPLRSHPLTSSANHWANTRCPVGVTDRESAEEGGGLPGGYQAEARGSCWGFARALLALTNPQEGKFSRLSSEHVTSRQKI